MLHINRIKTVDMVTFAISGAISIFKGVSSASTLKARKAVNCTVSLQDFSVTSDHVINIKKKEELDHAVEKETQLF